MENKKHQNSSENERYKHLQEKIEK